MIQKMNDIRTELRGISLVEIEAAIQRAGFEGFRARQIFHWLYKKDIRSFDEMANLPAPLREWLKERFCPGGVEIEQTLEDKDGSQKILYRLHDGLQVESVLMPFEGRRTLCISSQVGCALQCEFCLTGRIGFIRNLTTAEITDQVQCARRELLKGEPPQNIVVMGMGEPFLNTDAVIPALRLLTAPDAVGIPTRRITVSTAGVAPGIRALAEAALGVNLAVSINAPDDVLRSRLMPVNARYPLSELIKACEEFPLDNRRRITFEYILLDGINDSPAQAASLVRLVSHIRCKINLICYNEDERLPYRASPPQKVEDFRAILEGKGLTVAVRYSMGRGIKAACGQLAAGYLSTRESPEKGI